MTHSIGAGRQIKCLFCSSNQDYLCEVHDHVLNDYSLSDAKLTLAVIGDSTPRANNCTSEELSVIITVERPSDLLKHIESELDNEYRSGFKFLVLLTPELLEVMTDNDILDLIIFNHMLCPISLIFQTRDDRDKFKELYTSWIAPSNIVLPVLGITDDVGLVLEYLQSEWCKSPNRFIHLLKI